MFERFTQKPPWQKEVERFAAEDEAKKNAERLSFIQKIVWERISVEKIETAPTEEECLTHFKEMDGQQMPASLLTQLWFSNRFPSIGVKERKNDVRISKKITSSFQEEQASYRYFIERYGDQDAQEMCKKNLQWNNFAFDRAGVEGRDCLIDSDVLRLTDPTEVIEAIDRIKKRSVKIQDTIHSASRLNTFTQIIQGHIDVDTTGYLFDILALRQKDIIEKYPRASSIAAIAGLTKEEFIQRYAARP